MWKNLSPAGNLWKLGTSTAGFVGLAVRGPVEGVPQLVTKFSEFKRTYGGYLMKMNLGIPFFWRMLWSISLLMEVRAAFVARVAPSDAKCAGGLCAIQG